MDGNFGINTLENTMIKRYHVFGDIGEAEEGDFIHWEDHEAKMKYVLKELDYERKLRHTAENALAQLCAGQNRMFNGGMPEE